MAQSSLVDKLLSFAELIFRIHRFSAGFWELLSFRNVQVDIVVDEDVATNVFAVLYERLLVVMSLAKFLQETLIDFESLT